MAGPDEVVAPTQLLNERGLHLGDRLTVEIDGARSELTVVGETVRGFPGPEGLFAEWRTFPGTEARNFFYQVQATGGTDLDEFVAAVQAADPGLYAWNNTGDNEFAFVVTTFSTILGLLLAFILEALDNSLKTPADVERFVGLTTIGAIPTAE